MTLVAGWQEGGVVLFASSGVRVIALSIFFEDGWVIISLHGDGFVEGNTCALSTEKLFFMTGNLDTESIFILSMQAARYL